jgi:hypothetical protein
MTIAAGFVCSDGILLASDTLYSGAVNTFGQKFWILDHGDCCVVFGGAGTQRGLRRTRDEIQRGLQSGMSRQEVIESIDAALRDVNERLSPADSSERTDALIAIRTGEGERLYHNEGYSMLSVIDDFSHCVGFGNSLGFYFTRTLFRPNMPMRWAKVVAAHLIKQCKLHVGSCGGDTHLIELPSTGAPKFIDNQSEIQDYEQHLAQIDSAMSIVLPGADPNASDITIEHRLQILHEAIRKARGLAVAVMAHIPSTATVHAPAITPSAPMMPVEKKEEQ